MSVILQLVLVRHGETAWTVSGQHTGRTDLPLTAEGEAQARALRPRLAEMAFDAVLTSPLQRARETCAFAGLRETALPDRDLVEWNYGDYEAKRSTDIRKTRPGWNLWRDGCPNGETAEDIAARADRVIARLSQLRGNIVLFTHGQFAAALAVRWIGLAVYQGQHFALGPASLSGLTIDEARPEPRLIVKWNT